MNAAEEQSVAIHFNQRCMGYDLKTGAVRFRDENTSKVVNRDTGVVIGCDGSASAIRTEMLKLNRFNFSQQYLDYGYKELTIPAGANGKHLLETNALHIWPRGNHMLIALPNIDGTFACILFLPFEGADSFASVSTRSNVVRFFEDRFPDALRLMPELADNYSLTRRAQWSRSSAPPGIWKEDLCFWGTLLMPSFPSSGRALNCGLKTVPVWSSCLTSTAQTGRECLLSSRRA